MDYKSISFRHKFGLFSEQWQPKVIAEMNDYQFRVVKLQGDFVWHDHTDTDETFIAVEGTPANRFPGWGRQCVGWRDVRRPKGRGAQALCGRRGQVASH